MRLDKPINEQQKQNAHKLTTLRTAKRADLLQQWATEAMTKGGSFLQTNVELQKTLLGTTQAQDDNMTDAFDNNHDETHEMECDGDESIAASPQSANVTNGTRDMNDIESPGGNETMKWERPNTAATEDQAWESLFSACAL